MNQKKKSNSVKWFGLIWCYQIVFDVVINFSDVFFNSGIISRPKASP